MMLCHGHPEEKKIHQVWTSSSSKEAGNERGGGKTGPAAAGTTSLLLSYERYKHSWYMFRRQMQLKE